MGKDECENEWKNGRYGNERINGCDGKGELMEMVQDRICGKLIAEYGVKMR